MDIREKDRQRVKFLTEFYKETNGNTIAMVSMYDFGEHLKFSKRDTDSVVQWLVDERLIKYSAMGGIVSITPHGVRVVEEALRHPDQSIGNLPPVNIINIYGNLSNSPIQQGNVNSNQTVNVNIGKDQIEALKEALPKLRAEVEKLEIDSDSKDELITDIETIEKQAASKNPKTGAIKECWASIRKILESAAGGMAARAVMDNVHHLL